MSDSLYKFGRFELDAANKILRHDGDVVTLPLKPVELLCLLVENENEVVSKQTIFETVWKDSFVDDSALTQNIYKLRKLFEEFGESELIRTVPRRGYMFSPPEKAKVAEEIAPPPVVSTPVPEPIQTGRWRLAVYASAAVLLITLSVFAYWRLQGQPSQSPFADLRSIAVLPVKSLGGPREDDKLGVRIMDSLITQIGRTIAISVRPTSATMKYDGVAKDSLEIARELQVDAIIEGSYQLEDKKIRVTLQMVLAKTGEQIWSEQFDGESDRLLDLQNRVASRVLAELNLPRAIESQSELAKRPTVSGEAYEAYLKGRFLWYKRTPDSLRGAIDEFQNAIRFDGNFADAYVGLADSQYLLYDYGYDTSLKNVDSAKSNIARAMELNPNLTEAYSTLGLIQTSYDWDWRAAEESLRKAIKLAPNSPNAHHRFGTLLGRLRRFDESIAELKVAHELDPTSTAVTMNLGKMLMFAKRYDEATAQFNATFKLDASFNAPRWYLARTLWLNGQRRDGVAMWLKAVDGDGDGELAANCLKALESEGEQPAMKQLAAAWVKQIGPTGVNEHDMAIVNAFLADKSQTLDWLEKSVDAHHPWAAWTHAEPDFDFVREEPRFKALMKKLRFE